MSPMARAVRVCRLLEAGAMTKPELAEAVGLGERQIKRLLRAVEDAGVRVEVHDDHAYGVGRGGAMRRVYRIVEPACCDSGAA